MNFYGHLVTGRLERLWHIKCTLSKWPVSGRLFSLFQSLVADVGCNHSLRIQPQLHLKLMEVKVPTCWKAELVPDASFSVVFPRLMKGQGRHALYFIVYKYCKWYSRSCIIYSYMRTVSASYEPRLDWHLASVKALHHGLWLSTVFLVGPRGAPPF